MVKICDKFNKKIDKYKSDAVYIIFYNSWCGYCHEAFDYLKTKKKNFKGYDIDNIKGGIERILKCLNLNKDNTGFNPEHKTRPIIFYEGRFIGGFSDLQKVLGN